MLKMCSYGGCKRYATVRSRCDKHAAQPKQRKEYDHHRVGNLSNIYNSNRWMALRDKKIKQAPLCELCATVDKITPAAEIDHWLEIIDFRAYIFDIDNLVSLCSCCYRQKTAEYRRMRKSNPDKLIHWLIEHKPTPMSDAHKKLLQQAMTV